MELKIATQRLHDRHSFFLLEGAAAVFSVTVSSWKERQCVNYNSLGVKPVRT